MDFPENNMPVLVAVNPWSLESIGVALTMIALSPESVVNAAWPVANLAIFVPFSLSESVTFVKMMCRNGGTVSGNVDVGIYDVAGTRLVSMGSTAQAGATSIQEFNITDTVIGPGTFYLAIAMDNATGTLARVQPGSTLQGMLGIAEMASAFPLPATATFATPSNNYVPHFGATTRAVV